MVAPGQIHPADTSWPANILRFHVAFDRAMDVERAMDHVTLLRQHGATWRRDNDAFVDFPDGLWSTDQRLLTVLFHPGRVKRGLRARSQLGPPFVPGDACSIQISAEMPDALGRPLGMEVLHPFTVAPAVATALHVERRPPDDTGAISLTANRPWDIASAAVHIALTDPRGTKVPCIQQVAKQTLTLRPQAPCLTPLSVQIDHGLEDPCGNRLAAPFQA